MKDNTKHPGHYADEIMNLPRDQWESEISKAPKSMHPTIKKCINREWLRARRLNSNKGFTTAL